MIVRLRKPTIVFFVGLILFFSFQIHAQKQDLNPSKNTLWRVQSETNTIYLLGSIHLLKSENYPLHASIEKAYHDSKVVVLEADPGEMNSPQGRMDLMQKGMLPQGDSLEQYLDAQTYEKAKKVVTELGLDMAMFKSFKPWMFSMTLVVIVLQKYGFSPEYGIDLYFYNKAAQDGKSIIALETIQYQLGLFDNLSSILQDALIQQTLKDLENVIEKVDLMVKTWSTGDTKGLEKFLLDNFMEYPGIYKALIVNRNKNWMQHIESLMKKKENHMIIVGAGHLVGQDGLVELLKKKGYKPEQL